MKDEIVLEVKDVKSSYGAIEVLQGVSLSIKKGEVITLIGANGAGKTTLVKTIMGLIRPKIGSILFNGQSIVYKPTHEIINKGLTLVPEGRQIFSPLTVKENLALGATSFYSKDNKTKNKNRINELLEWVFHLFPILKERQQQIAGTLSGGEQQMLAIGRGLMSDPNLLILDEPSLGVAPLIVEEIYETLTTLNKSGLSLLVIEQNVELALSISNRTYLMGLGKIVKEGNSTSFLDDKDIQSVYMGIEK